MCGGSGEKKREEEEEKADDGQEGGDADWLSMDDNDKESQGDLGENKGETSEKGIMTGKIEKLARDWDRDEKG